MTLARPAARTIFAVVGAAALVSFFRSGRVSRWMPVARYAVDGPSMEPAYHAGDRIVVNRLAYLRCRPAAGDVVVLRDPERDGHVLVKRVAFDVGRHEAAVYVLGDNAEASRDSRAFGPVPVHLVVGKAWFRY